MLIYRNDHDFSKSIEKVFDLLLADDSLNFVKYKAVGGLNIIDIIVNIIRIVRTGINRIHITGDVHYYALLRLFGKNVTCTIHDIDNLRYLTGLKRFFYFVGWVLIPLMFCNKVVAISPHVHEKLERISKRYRLKATIKLIPNPVLLSTQSNNFISFQDRKFDLIQVGTAPHKNAELSLQIAKSLDLTIAIVGKLDTRLMKEALSHPGAKIYEYIDDRELSALYENSRMLLFFSSHEGFGLPLIEAQAHGCLVLSSSLEPMRWVVGKGGVCFDPTLDQEKIKSFILATLNDSSGVTSILDLGFSNTSRFSPESFVSNYRRLLFEHK